MEIFLYELVGHDVTRPFSPHCWKARMALRHKGLEYTSLPVPFTKVRHVEDGFDRTVPVLRHGKDVVQDSFAIAEYLETTYPDRPSLFGGEGGRAMARFVESWSHVHIRSFVVSAALMDIYSLLDEVDKEHFRRTREAFFGMRLEDVVNRDPARLDEFSRSLEPMRLTLKRQPFLNGKSSGFADYIVFGLFQWLRITSSVRPLAPDDSVSEWFERCLDLFDGEGRKITAA
ncbi:glutathione S-transferase family protein [Aureimonas fodinaquatilis]|uniref:Glutathione S-transferase family protein n=1 Tax=Aureimonas fodinaquatilis TaxID=2565783 RepID=A0A5B0DWL8_9HYPH|nr:glutathione S-transferase family protein [Aureimonas fodinaquatilis]KAA0970221.1 glutathione S-transferase family protein [Aureimonas fodinaquatilis]